MEMIYPCHNLFCRLNNSGVCEADSMLNLMCSGLDMYNQCKERKEGEELIKSLERLWVKFIIKNKKREIGYYGWHKFYRKNFDWFTVNPLITSDFNTARSEKKKEMENKVRNCPKCGTKIQPS